MRLVGEPLLDAFPNRILNIHPSLLPAFPGPRGAAPGARAWRSRERRDRPSRDAELDGGPIILQAAVPVMDDDTVDTLSARILVEEHRIYPGGDSARARRRMAAGGPAVRQTRRVLRVLEREDGDFWRAVDPHRHVDGSDAAADEHGGVVLARRKPATTGNFRAAIAPTPAAEPPVRRACGPRAPAGCSALRLRPDGGDRGRAARPCPSRALHQRGDVRRRAWSRSGCRRVRCFAR